MTHSVPASPSPKLNSSAEADRERATPVTMKALCRVFERWKLTNSEAALLVGVSEQIWNRMKGDSWTGVLSQEQLLRASALIGIFKSLHLYFSEQLADDWVTLPNSGPSFLGRRPLDAMIANGLPAMYDTRDYLDALRGGL